MCENDFTGKETDRQDCVDNSIQNLICEMAGRDVEWNMENIGEVRDVLQGIIVDKLKLMTEQEFYPYREIGTDGNIILEPSKPQQGEEMIVTDEQLVTAMQKQLVEMDADELAQLAGDALGGLCWYLSDGTYSF